MLQTGSGGKERLPRLPAGRRPCNVLITERMQPLPRDVRERIIGAYCPPQLQDSVRASRNDEDCLIRIYTGDPAPRARERSFAALSLRNFPAILAQLRELGCLVEGYISVTADALAICHWVAVSMPRTSGS
jgi:hypothetical protein